MAEIILPCKLVAQVAFKAGGDVFHDIMANTPHELANCSPATVQACELHHGSFGKKGSIIEWKYTLGKLTVIKLIESNLKVRTCKECGHFLI